MQNVWTWVYCFLYVVYCPLINVRCSLFTIQFPLLTVYRPLSTNYSPLSTNTLRFQLFTFPFGYYGAGYSITNHVRSGAAHVEDLIYSQ